MAHDGNRQDQYAAFLTDEYVGGQKGRKSSFATLEEYTVATEFVSTEKTGMDKAYGAHKSDVLQEFVKMK